MTADLNDLVYSAFEKFSDLTAVEADGKKLTYAELGHHVQAAACYLSDNSPQDGKIGLLSQRTINSIVTILATTLSARTYVPLNPKFPAERLVNIAKAAECDLVVYDQSHAEMAALLECKTVCDAEWPDVATQTRRVGRDRRAAEPVYIMFTSGTTGTPKGVPISNRNLQTYLSAIRQVAQLGPGDRCSHFFDLSFDLSVHDIFHTLTNGATLVIPKNEELIDPVGFSLRHNLTCWFSVPSVVATAARMKRAKKNALPSLRLSLFCGEALPLSIAKLWSEVAPQSSIFNLYGPTEATIAISSYKLEEADFDSSVSGSNVPLGRTLQGSRIRIVGSDGHDVTAGETGELYLGGPQVSEGYWNRPELTGSKFLVDESDLNGRWYKSGDFGYESVDGVFHFAGRIDEQVKVNGYRVEIAEVEEALRWASKVPEVAVVCNKDSSGLSILVGFIVAQDFDTQLIIDQCLKKIPQYMCPKRLISVNHLPLNANGKIDRNALLKLSQV